MRSTPTKAHVLKSPKTFNLSLYIKKKTYDGPITSRINTLYMQYTLDQNGYIYLSITFDFILLNLISFFFWFHNLFCFCFRFDIFCLVWHISFHLFYFSFCTIQIPIQLALPLINRYYKLSVST